MIVRATAPDNINPARADKVMQLGPEAVPALIHVFEHARQPRNVGGAACDQGLLAVALLSHARNGNEAARAFLQKVAQYEVKLYDFGGQRAVDLAKDFVRECKQETKTREPSVGTDEEIAELVATFGDRGDRRLKAMERLCKIGEPALLKVVEAMSDQSPHVRWNVALALGVKGLNTAVPHLVAVIKKQTKDSVKTWNDRGMPNYDLELVEHALISLGRLKARAASPVIKELIARGFDNDWGYIALAEIGDEEFLKDMVALAQDKSADVNVRIKAIKALGWSKTEETRRVLEEMSGKDENSSLRYEVKNALRISSSD